MIKLLDNISIQPTKFRTKNWAEMMIYVEHITTIVELNLKVWC